MNLPGLPSLLFLVILLVLIPLGAWRTSRRLQGALPGKPVSRLVYWRSAVFTQVFLLGLAWMVASTFGFRIFAPPVLDGSLAGLSLGALALCFVVREITRRSRTEEERRRLAVYRRSPRTPVEAAWFAASVVCAGVAEEAAYRGVGWQVLTYTTGNAWLAAAILSVAFALAHWSQGWKSGLAVASLAAIFHGLVALTGTLLVAMVVHTVYDFAAGYLIQRQARSYDRQAGGPGEATLGLPSR